MFHELILVPYTAPLTLSEETTLLLSLAISMALKIAEQNLFGFTIYTIYTTGLFVLPLIHVD
jgi:hypothetical protein